MSDAADRLIRAIERDHLLRLSRKAYKQARKYQKSRDYDEADHWLQVGDWLAGRASRP